MTPEPTPTKTAGQVACDAYHGWTGRSLSAWDACNPSQKQEWNRSAAAVIAHHEATRPRLTPEQRERVREAEEKFRERVRATPPPPGETPRTDHLEAAEKYGDFDGAALALCRSLERELAASQAAVRELCGVLDDLVVVNMNWNANVTEIMGRAPKVPWNDGYLDAAREALAKHAPKEGAH